METKTYKQAVISSISHAVRELSTGLLSPQHSRIESLLVSAIVRIAKAEYGIAGKHLNRARNLATMVNDSVYLNIERAELMLDRWLTQRPEKEEMPHSIDTRGERNV